MSKINPLLLSILTYNKFNNLKEILLIFCLSVLIPSMSISQFIALDNNDEFRNLKLNTGEEFFLSGLSKSPIQRSGRKFLRATIEEWGECKNVAMTLTGGDIALYGKSGWAAQGAPVAMTNKLRELNSTSTLIDDIVITEKGRWLILYGNNGITSFSIPKDLDSKLRQWNNEHEIINSITFNDWGDWIAITKDKFATSSEKIRAYIRDGESKHGEFWAAHITNDGLVLCYESGYQFYGNVPDNLKQRLRETKINVYRIKFLSDGSYFFADINGNYGYNM